MKVKVLQNMEFSRYSKFASLRAGDVIEVPDNGLLPILTNLRYQEAYMNVPEDTPLTPNVNVYFHGKDSREYFRRGLTGGRHFYENHMEKISGNPQLMERYVEIEEELDRSQKNLEKCEELYKSDSSTEQAGRLLEALQAKAKEVDDAISFYTKRLRFMNSSGCLGCFDFFRRGYPPDNEHTNLVVDTERLEIELKALNKQISELTLELNAERNES